MNIKEELKKVIQSNLKDHNFDIDINDIYIEIPKEENHGDFSSNIAMKISKQMSKSPLDIANLMKDTINSPLVDKVEVAGFGFINFFVKKDYLLENINNILKDGTNYGRSKIGNKAKINVEFVSVNPTGSLHLGHVRGACFGDTLSNILEFTDHIPTREYYINDAGNQMNNMALSIKERYKELLGQKIEMEENYYHGEEITDVAKILFEESKEYLTKDLEFFKKRGLEIFLNNIKEDLEKIDVRFDIWSSEQKLKDDKKVEESLEKLRTLGYIYEQEGATWLKTSDFGDEKDRVIIKTDGSYTYFLPDIAYHLDKLQRGYDLLIDVLGADHHGYASRIKASVSMLGGNKNKLEVDLIQMVRAIKDNKEYKLSKRTGKSITLNDLIEYVGADAVRYFFIARSIDSQMDFNIDLALSKSNENPVYYIQYAHARICSILREQKDVDFNENIVFETIESKSAINILSKLYEFREVIETAAQKRTPHMLTNYLYDLATLFHSYYNQEKIITNDEKYTKERIYLIKAIEIVLKNALKLIGVTAPEKM